MNTLKKLDDGRLLGDNTDGAGLVRDIEANLGFPLAGKRILLLGAGGAARGVIAPLLACKPAGLTIANRSADKAQALAEQFSDIAAVDAGNFAKTAGSRFDVIINATSASLQGQMPELPPGLVGEDTFCYDLAYGKGHTPFTLWAKSLYAARISKGWGMLVEQAAESFFLWRGVRPSTHSVLEALTRKA